MRRFQDVSIPPEYIGDSIMLTSKIDSLQSGTSGAGTNVRAMMNTTKAPIEIYELKFRIRSVVATAGHVVSCRLDVGDFSLTNGPIPLFAFGRAENVSVEQASGSSLLDNVNGYYYSHYIARLSRPIYLPAGAAIRPQLTHNGQTPQPVAVHISAVGRKLPLNAPVPAQLFLPYWSAFTGKAFTLGIVDSDQSPETALANPFDVPLLLERFVGRVGYYAAASAFSQQSVSSEQENNLLLSFNGGPSLGHFQTIADALGQVKCTVFDSNGSPIVRRPTPMRLVFDLYTRSWPVTTKLDPGGYISVTFFNDAWYTTSIATAVDVTNPAAGDPTAGGGVQAQPTVAMLGWREVR